MNYSFKNSILLVMSLSTIIYSTSFANAMSSEASETSECSSGNSYYSDENSSKEDAKLSIKHVKKSKPRKESSSSSYSEDSLSENSHNDDNSEQSSKNSNETNEIKCIKKNPSICSKSESRFSLNKPKKAKISNNHDSLTDDDTSEKLSPIIEKPYSRKNPSLCSKSEAEIPVTRPDKSKQRSKRSSFYVDPDNLVPENILINPYDIIKNRIKNRYIELSVSAPTVIETTPGQFLIDVSLENKTNSQLNNLSIGIEFYNGEELSLIPPVPEVKDISLLHNKRFSFNVSVSQINNENKRSSFCVYLYSYGSDGTRADVPYLISSYTQQIHLNQSVPKKAIIVVPGICGSELFSNSAQVIDGNQYSRGYRIWPPEGAMRIADSSILCTPCNTITTDSERLLNDFGLIACNEDGSSKADIMPINPIIDCATNIEHRNFGSVNCYGGLIESLISSPFLSDYQTVFFSYDWRLSNDVTGQKLDEFIEEQQFSNVVLIGHSMGGLVCSSYVKHCSDISKIEKVILLGAPIHGAAKAFSAMEKGTFFDGVVGFISSPVAHPFIKNLAKSCPSIYELLPPSQAFRTLHDGYLFERNGACGFSKDETYSADTYEDSCQLIKCRNSSDETETLLTNAQQFHDSLYDEDGTFILSKDNIDVYNLVGFNTKTSKGFYVKITRHGTKCKLTDILCNGDGTVSLSSSTVSGDFPLSKTYFARNISHMGLMQNENCLDLINNIIANRPEEFNPSVIQKFLPEAEVTCNGCIPILRAFDCN